MTKDYMVVFERAGNNWSAFSPDIPGCGSLGADLEETRANVREALELYLVESAKAGEPLPEPAATTVDFEEFDSDYRSKQYVIEWVPVAMPQSATRAA
jgi:predicted RNase H-like HicB family nuclease